MGTLISHSMTLTASPTRSILSKFALSNLSGSWANSDQVLAFNDHNTRAASHIFVTTFPANASNSALATGFAAEGGTVVPDGGTTVMLLGAALGALGMVRRFLMG